MKQDNEKVIIPILERKRLYYAMEGAQHKEKQKYLQAVPNEAHKTYINLLGKAIEKELVIIFTEINNQQIQGKYQRPECINKCQNVARVHNEV